MRKPTAVKSGGETSAFTPCCYLDLYDQRLSPGLLSTSQTTSGVTAAPRNAWLHVETRLFTSSVSYFNTISSDDQRFFGRSGCSCQVRSRISRRILIVTIAADFCRARCLGLPKGMASYFPDVGISVMTTQTRRVSLF